MHNVRDTEINEFRFELAEGWLEIKVRVHMDVKITEYEARRSKALVKRKYHVYGKILLLLYRHFFPLIDPIYNLGVSGRDKKKHIE